MWHRDRKHTRGSNVTQIKTTIYKISLSLCPSQLSTVSLTSDMLGNWRGALLNYHSGYLTQVGVTQVVLFSNIKSEILQLKWCDYVFCFVFRSKLNFFTEKQMWLSCVNRGCNTWLQWHLCAQFFFSSLVLEGDYGKTSDPTKSKQWLCQIVTVLCLSVTTLNREAWGNNSEQRTARGQTRDVGATLYKLAVPHFVTEYLQPGPFTNSSKQSLLCVKFPSWLSKEALTLKNYEALKSFQNLGLQKYLMLSRLITSSFLALTIFKT